MLFGSPLNQKINGSINTNLNLDAAGAVRVAQKTILGSYVQDKNDLPQFYNRVNNGTATQVWGGEVVSMSSGTGYAIAQTYKRHLYLAGFSQSPEMTFNNFGNESGVVKRLGYFSSATSAPYNSGFDGFFLQSDGSAHSLEIYKNGVSIASIPRVSWYDPLDGTGPSKVNIDFNNFTVVEWQFLYLGGTGLEMRFNVGGTLYLAHVYKNSSINNSTFIGSPVQPIRYEVRNNGSAGQLGQICAGVSTAGALDIPGYPRSANPAVGTFINANSIATQYLLCAIKPNNVRAVGFEIKGETLSLTNDPYTLRFILNPTIANAPTFNQLSNSSFDFALGDTSAASNTTVTGGETLDTTFVSDRTRSGSLSANSLFQLGADLDGNFDTLALVVEPETTNLDVKGAINFKEL